MARTAKITNANVAPRQNAAGLVGNTPVRAQDFNDLAGDYVSLSDASAQAISSAVSVAGAASIAGALTASASLIFGTQAVTAAGSDQAGAADISLTGGTVVVVTNGGSNPGVKLPALSGVTAGTIFLICNNHASNTLEVYPNTGDAINPASDNAGITIAADTVMLCIAIDGVALFGAELPVVAA